MNFVSVVTDPANLFDYESGIYVLGKRFDDAVAEGQDYTIEENQGLFPANYEGKGKEWEREAHADFFGTDGALLLSQDLGIRIKGHATRSRLPRGLNFYARKEYGGEKTFGADLLGLGYPVRRMSLYAGGTDRSKAKSAMLAEILRDRSFATITYVPYVLFLDGEYWGVYWLTDKFDATYVEENFGLDKDEAVIIKDGAVELGNEEDIGLYEELQRFFEETDLSVPENYEQAGTLVDMQSLIDYYATEIYVANCDWPFNNFQLWRSRDGGGEGYADGRWRWMLYDLDGIGCMDQWMAGSVSIADVRASDVIFDSLSANAEFRQDFCATLRELGDGVFSSEQIAPVIDRYVSLMYLPVEKESARFAREEEDAAWVQGEYMKGFFENRREFIEGQIEDYLSQ